MASLRIALLALLVLATGLQLSACLLKEMKDLHSHWDEIRREKQHVLLKEVVKSLPQVIKRAAGDPPVIDGDHTFNDGYTHARIHYSGDDSAVIFVLTYTLGSNGIPTRTNLYRSEDYGATFLNINSRLSSSVVLSPTFFVSDFNHNFLLFAHATESRIYYTLDEGLTFSTREITAVDINPRTIQYHPTQDGWMMALDTSNALYATRDYGESWSKVDDDVAFYQWADSKWDENPLTIYYATTDPDNSDVYANLFTSSVPYTTHKPFDPNFGAHDAFLVHGPYIFAQRTDDAGRVSLYVSHHRKPFQLAMIPTPSNHRNYLVGDIDELVAMVIVQHEGGFYNLYLSDTTGVYFSLSLRDIVVERNSVIDLEIINGVNGTLIANQYVRDDPSEQNAPIRTLISLDNGGFWQLIVPPSVDVNNNPLNCEPPTCSLHLHMGTSAYSRLGIYSTSSAPGLIIAHGIAGETLTDNPDLYISRDGGITWEETLAGSWGVNVADHGGLIVAARDYHQEMSSELMYSCNEGYTWTSFRFSTTPATIYGVITQPGHHTTIMSLYGMSRGHRQWRVVTINFENIYERNCSAGDYTQWMPWDQRSGTDCILGSTVTIERRKARTCCLNGRDYDRLISFDICECNGEDFECDYGYARYDLTGPCLRDRGIELPDPCAGGKTSYTASTGYRKIAGDVCEGGAETVYGPFNAPCH